MQQKYGFQFLTGSIMFCPVKYMDQPFLLLPSISDNCIDQFQIVRFFLIHNSIKILSNANRQKLGEVCTFSLFKHDTITYRNHVNIFFTIVEFYVKNGTILFVT